MSRVSVDAAGDLRMHREAAVVTAPRSLEMRVNTRCRKPLSYPESIIEQISAIASTLDLPTPTLF